MANSTIRKEQLRDIPLVVMESDDSPSIYPVDTIKFSGATVTDLGGGDVLVTVLATASGGGTALTVMELDGSPSISNVDTIKFSGAYVSDLGNGDVLVTVSGGPTPASSRVFTFTSEGNIAVGTGKLRLYNIFGQTYTITKVQASVYSAPTGATILVDVNKNGTTLFTNQAHRPTIAIGANTGDTTLIDVSSFADGDYLTMDIDQVGSTNAGAELSVQVLFG